ncbi:MAG: hypothetical protein GEU82_03910 [Luteitalea sp.]|nr:hypothetical protein [Luteitalea sp.]
MRKGLLASISGLVIAVAFVWLSAPVSGQTGAKWTPPKTSWGDPDIQGQWNSQTSTPLERPLTGELAGKQELSDEEAETLENEARQSFDEAPRAGDPGTYNAFWRDEGKGLTRTSLIIDPSDGRVPPLTPEAEKRAVAERAARSQRGPADTYADLSLWTRCISRGWNGIGSWYSSNYQIFQSPGYVVVLQELIHEPRIIPLDGRPHLPQGVGQWLGDSRGRWEGNTLVVETTNFDPKTSYRGSRDTLKLVERYTPLDANTLDYQFTVNDATTFTKPWTVSRPMRRQTDGISIFEYACHEGNYAMEGILKGARVQEKAGAPSPQQQR